MTFYAFLARDVRKKWLCSLTVLLVMMLMADGGGNCERGGCLKKVWQIMLALYMIFPSWSLCSIKNMTSTYLKLNHFPILNFNFRKRSQIDVL